MDRSQEIWRRAGARCPEGTALCLEYRYAGYHSEDARLAVASRYTRPLLIMKVQGNASPEASPQCHNTNLLQHCLKRLQKCTGLACFSLVDGSYSHDTAVVCAKYSQVAYKEHQELQH